MGQGRELPNLPSSYVELGHVLHSFRGGWSLRDAAQLTHGVLSSSALQRYEQGDRLPLEKAAVLDEIYFTDGWISAAVAGLELPSWNWPRLQETQHAAHRWPSSWAGPVWVAVRPSRPAFKRPYELRCDWGPWRFDETLIIPGGGIVLLTGKATEEQSVALHVSSDRPLRVMFGLGPPSGAAQIVDINDRWEWRAGPTQPLA